MSDQEIDSLLTLADELVKRAREGGADVAEAVARSGSELSVKVRLGEPELVEEAGHRSIGMRVMKGKRVALTSTSDLTPRGLDRFVADALELAELSEEDPFAGPADPALVGHGPYPDLDLMDASLASVTAKDALERARESLRAADIGFYQTPVEVKGPREAFEDFRGPFLESAAPELHALRGAFFAVL